MMMVAAEDVINQVNRTSWTKNKFSDEADRRPNKPRVSAFQV